MSGVGTQGCSGSSSADGDQIVPGGGQGLLADPLDGESGVGDHPVVVGAGLAFTGEIIAQEDRVGQVQSQWLQTAQMNFATSGQTNLDVGEAEAEQCQDPQAPSGCEIPALAQRVPSNGMRKLTGTESGSESRSARTTSMMSSSDSPMPKIAPEHGDRPAAPARRRVSTRSAKVCVVQICG